MALRKLIVYCSALFFSSLSINAQTFEDFKKQSREEFHSYRETLEKELKAYREKINSEYAEFMRRPWIRHDVAPAAPVPVRPEPPKPVAKVPEEIHEPEKRILKFDELLPVPKAIAAPLPASYEEMDKLGSIKTSLPTEYDFTFDYYGTACSVPLTDDMRFMLNDVSENSVADKWESLSSDKSWTLVLACLDLRNRMNLCDWGYVRFVEKMTNAFYGSQMQNEACLTQMYILAQSGYKVRMARTGNRLVMMLPSDNNIWQYPYMRVNGCRYFIMNASSGDDGYYLFDHEFPQEQMFSLRMESAPKLKKSFKSVHSYSSKRYPELEASVAANQNLVAFYKDYPLSNDWDIYAKASLSDDVKNQLYPSLRMCVGSKSELEAAEILLNFVQTAFEYKMDQDQFGYEKPFFADEIFGYPYSDCEDRSILFSVLVHDLLGLEVVMIDYPDHMATAVKFNDSVQGAYFDLKDEHYTICDPTFIGASVGEVMPNYADASAKIIRIW